ncbi:MAG: KpsF/GutQ family sugar-phosphate isomerase [Proteobacteria bacterium]|nr:KpsF/GutQ family sugar-phosphate isomerase [Pseudomonadota bacterium]
MNKQQALNIGVETLKQEIAGLQNLVDNFQHDRFTQAAEMLANVKGKIIFFGIGKTGHICKKLAATLASTGSSAFFVHAAEANHGDLGMIGKDDILVAISHSGESRELFPTARFCKNQGIPVISLTNNDNSTLGKLSTVVLRNFCDVETGCPLRLAPTTSTTATLALGDALAMAVMDSKSFTPEDFGVSHPGGKLGARTAPSKDMMETLPIIDGELTVDKARKAVSDYRLGCGVILNADKSLAGFISDGDLRRAGRDDLIKNAMTIKPSTINQDELAMAGYNKMVEEEISNIVVINSNEMPIGVLDRKVLDKSFA